MLSEKRSKIIEQVNFIVLIVYFLLIFEGAIRKWIFPQWSSPLFFIKDPFALYLYGLCFYYKLFPLNFYFRLTMVLAMMFYLLMTLQSLFIPINMFAGIYGWRTYFFFLPMAFIIGEYYSKEDLIRIAKFTCLAGIPIALLTYVQYQSPLDSYINKNVGTEESLAFTVVDNIVRPSGTFSFTTGQSSFIVSMLLMLLFNFFLKKEDRFLNPILFYICIFAFFTNLAVSGSRGAFVGVSIVIVFLLFAAFILFNRRQGFNIIVYLILGLVMTCIVFYLFFAQEWDIISRRNELAEESEGSIFTRMMSLFISIDFFKSANPPLLGYGLGLSSGGGSFIATGKSNFALAETDWARNVLEAGMFLGPIYILYRIFFMISIFREALYSVIKSKNPMPFIFLGFVVPSLLIGSITGNGTSNVYNWLFVGFALAINRVYSQEAENADRENAD